MSKALVEKMRAWCFTINNYDEENWKLLKEMDCTYLVMGKEMSSTGTPHIQGYIYFKNARTRNGISKTKEFKRAALFAAKGTAIDNEKYCKKEGREVFEKGMMPQQGERTDLLKLKDVIDKCGNDLSALFSNEETFGSAITNIKGLMIYMNTKLVHRDKPPICIWLYGKTGTGKTRYAYDYFGKNGTYIKDGTKWWDGYKQETCIIIDDFDGKWPYRDFLRLLDRYPYQGQVKNGYVAINSDYIFITCEYTPAEIFPNEDERSQVMRRLFRVVNMNTKIGLENLLPDKSSKSESIGRHVSFLLEEGGLGEESSDDECPPLDVCASASATT